jgi:hypothetical protein
MEFLLLIEDRRGEPARMQIGVAEMQKFHLELIEAGVLLAGAGPLAAESAGARVRIRDGRRLVTAGPFAETKEIVCGYWVVKADSREAAIELAKRCPYARAGQIEVRQAGSSRADSSPLGPRFLILLREGPNPELRDGPAEYADMVAYTEALRREGRYLESAGLPRQARAARVEVRDGKPLVSDGPFAESKEIVGGLVLIQAADRDEAIAIAARCPHVTWGCAEVRAVQSAPSA